MQPTILSIETSCDETSVAILTAKHLTQVTASQIDVHRITGGIVPEVAAREHVQVMLPLVQEAMRQADVTREDIDRIAVTSGPGLMTSLMVGVETARTLAYTWEKPLFGINHIEGHIAANWLPAVEESGEKSSDDKNGTQLTRAVVAAAPDIEFPAVALVVSGGHTELLYVPKPGTYELIGATRDDAAGECFDKCARILGLPYPGGPAISEQATEGTLGIHEFPSPMVTSQNFDFSFSGLKTSVLYFHRDNPDARLADVCAGIEESIVHVLVSKAKRAVKKYKAKSLLVGGGVSANQKLRARLETACAELDVSLYIPSSEFCTDNAAMIAAACMFHDQPRTELFELAANPNWELTPR